jgi:hypothetical protein
MEYHFMARKVFFSFCWDDNWAVNQIRNIGTFETMNKKFTDHADIEAVKRSSNESIKKWINDQLDGATVTCVLIGSDTSQSKWVSYEIDRSLERKMGVFGIFVHKIKGKDGLTSPKGQNPFHHLSNVNLNAYDPSIECNTSTTYECISDNIEKWIERAAKQAGR